MTCLTIIVVRMEAEITVRIIGATKGATGPIKGNAVRDNIELIATAAAAIINMNPIECGHDKMLREPLCGSRPNARAQSVGAQESFAMFIKIAAIVGMAAGTILDSVCSPLLFQEHHRLFKIEGGFTLGSVCCIEALLRGLGACAYSSAGAAESSSCSS